MRPAAGAFKGFTQQSIAGILRFVGRLRDLKSAPAAWGKYIIIAPPWARR